MNSVWNQLEASIRAARVIVLINASRHNLPPATSVEAIEVGRKLRNESDISPIANR